MPLTLGTLWDQVLAVIEAQGFVRAITPFDFDLQPDGSLHRAYHCTTERDAIDPYLGGNQGQAHVFRIYLAVRTQRNPWGAARQLLADLEALESALLAAEAASSEYYIHDDPGPAHEIQQPVEGDYVVGSFTFVAEFDRSP